MFCVGLGIVVANVLRVPAAAVPASGVAAGPVLKLGVVLLGLDLVFPDILALGLKALVVVVAVVAITFFGTRWAGNRLGISSDLSLLVATGFSICGVSAIAAADGVIDADEDEVAFAVALVTLCGTLAIVTLPPLRHPLGSRRRAVRRVGRRERPRRRAGRRDIVDRGRRRRSRRRSSSS